MKYATIIIIRCTKCEKVLGIVFNGTTSAVGMHLTSAAFGTASQKISICGKRITRQLRQREKTHLEVPVCHMQCHWLDIVSSSWTNKQQERTHHDMVTWQSCVCLLAHWPMIDWSIIHSKIWTSIHSLSFLPSFTSFLPISPWLWYALLLSIAKMILLPRRSSRPHRRLRPSALPGSQQRQRQDASQKR